VRSEHLVESKTSILRLSREQSKALHHAAKRLATSSTWWGSDGESSSSSALSVRSRGHDEYEVKVHNAVGVISLGDLQLVIEPKIPIEHFAYLLARSGALPQVDSTTAYIDEGRQLWDLVACAFLDETDIILRHDLRRDYRNETAFLSNPRGRIDPLRTATQLLKGSTTALCEYQEFDDQTPLNRTLRSAAEKLTRIPGLQAETRHRARRTLRLLEHVGPLQPGDLLARPDRQLRHYVAGHQLALSIINSTALLPTGGTTPAKAFLLRSPGLIEDAIRAILRSDLKGAEVTKTGRRIEGSGYTINPDLVFDQGRAVADVKYKISGRTPLRSDLYQSVAFATGFGCTKSAILSFGHSDEQRLALKIGDVSVSGFVWDISIGPEQARARLSDQVNTWLDGESVESAAR